LVGVIRGERLPAETKLGLVRAVAEARRAGATVAQVCQVLKLSRTRLYRWLEGKGMEEVAVADLFDRPPIARVVGHRITEVERESILGIAREEEYADLRHRKLAHMLGRLKKVFVSESTVLRVLKKEGLIAPPVPRQRPKRQKPEVKVDGPNQVWRWDISYVLVGMTFWYLIAILDQYSRKIVGWGFFPQATQAEAKRVWDHALLNEGLLDSDKKRMPQAVSDRGSQMKGKSIKAFFRDLGIMQIFCRPHTPDDNAEMESFFATLKCERLYRGSYGEGQALQAEADIAVFIEYYNCGRLHQGIGFVTPQERHDGRDKELREDRQRGLELARLLRVIEHGGQGIQNGGKNIETRELHVGRDGGSNQEVTGVQVCSLIIPGVVS